MGTERSPLLCTIAVGGRRAWGSGRVYTMAELTAETGVHPRVVKRLVAAGGLPRPFGRNGQPGPRWGAVHLAALRSYVTFCAFRQVHGRGPRNGHFVGSVSCRAEFCERQRRARAA